MAVVAGVVAAASGCLGNREITAGLLGGAFPQTGSTCRRLIAPQTSVVFIKTGKEGGYFTFWFRSVHHRLTNTGHITSPDSSVVSSSITTS